MPLHATVLVDQECDLRLLLMKCLEQLIERRMFRHKDRRAGEQPQDGAVVAGGMKGFEEFVRANDADHVVEPAIAHGQCA